MSSDKKLIDCQLKVLPPLLSNYIECIVLILKSNFVKISFKFNSPIA